MAKIFLVDDEISTCQIMERFFRMKGYEYVFEPNADNVVEVYRKEVPDIALIDINLGNDQKNGIDLLREIRSFDTETKIVMLSGMVMTEQYEQEAVKLGASAFLQKPVAPTKLLETIKELLAPPN